MNKSNFRIHLKSGVATSILGAAAFFGFQGEAKAGSVCTASTITTPNTFSCADAAATADGAYSDGATFSQAANGGFAISAPGLLDVTLSGQLNASTTTAPGLTTAVSLTATETVTFTNTGSIISSSDTDVQGIYLRSDQSIEASTGQVSAIGSRASGVVSETMNGNNTLTGGTTIVSGEWSKGLWSDAYGGSNVTNTGNVTATGAWSRGVIARAIPLTNGCDPAGNQSTTVNVTGNVSADFVGVLVLTCGTGTVNVNADQTVQTTGIEGQAIRNIALDSAVTNINGSVLAASTSDRALDSRSASSTTVIGSTGLLSGTFAGDEGDDSISLVSGGKWVSAGASEFRSGNDTVVNNGTIEAVAVQFNGLETFDNTGVLAISGGSFELVGSSSFTNTGTIYLAPGATTITSNADFYNNGTISMENGQAGDVLTITNNYVAGSLASLVIDVAGDVSDSFVVQGTTSGTTQIYVSAASTIASSAIRIGVTDTSTGTFSLTGDANQSGVQVSLGNQSLTRLIDLQMSTVGNELYLAALPNITAFQPLVVGHVGRDLWYQSAEIVAANAGLATAKAEVGPARPVSLWGQLYAASDRSGEKDSGTLFSANYDVDNRIQTDRVGIQVGADLLSSEFLLAGVTAGYERAKGNLRGQDGGIKAEGFNIGAYGSLGRPTGPYGTALLKYDQANASLTDSAFESANGDPDLKSYGAQFEAGYRWEVRSTRFGVGASFAFVNTSIDDFDAEGIEYDFKSNKSVRGSLAARADFGNMRIAPFIEARLGHEFNSDGEVTFASGIESDTFQTKGSQTWLKLEAGLGASAGSGPILAGWLKLGDIRGVGVRGGWRF